MTAENVDNNLYPEIAASLLESAKGKDPQYQRNAAQDAAAVLKCAPASRSLRQGARVAV